MAQREGYKKLNVKLENISEKKNGFWKQFNNPIVVMILIPLLFGGHAFLIQKGFINPAKAEINEKVNKEVSYINNEINGLKHINSDQNYKIDTNAKFMNDHKVWCDNNLAKELELRPTTKELEPQLRAIRESIGKLEKTVDDSMKIIIQKLK